LAAPLQPIKRAGLPEDVAKVVAFLIDNDQSGFVTGSDYLVDGGTIVAGGINMIEGNPIADVYRFIEK